jgi:hypothetical protein
MVPVVISVDVADACDATVANRCAIVSVSSNEPVDAAGDGKTSPDWQFRGLLLSLRAERSGAGQGRVYTVGIRCADAAGNAATKSVTVTVPHNH